MIDDYDNEENKKLAEGIRKYMKRRTGESGIYNYEYEVDVLDDVDAEGIKEFIKEVLYN